MTVIWFRVPGTAEAELKRRWFETMKESSPCFGLENTLAGLQDWGERGQATSGRSAVSCSYYCIQFTTRTQQMCHRNVTTKGNLNRNCKPSHRNTDSDIQESIPKNELENKRFKLSATPC